MRRCSWRMPRVLWVGAAWLVIVGAVCGLPAGGSRLGRTGPHALKISRQGGEGGGEGRGAHGQGIRLRPGDLHGPAAGLESEETLAEEAGGAMQCGAREGSVNGEDPIGLSGWQEGGAREMGRLRGRFRGGGGGGGGESFEPTPPFASLRLRGGMPPKGDAPPGKDKKKSILPPEHETKKQQMRRIYAYMGEKKAAQKAEEDAEKAAQDEMLDYAYEAAKNLTVKYYTVDGDSEEVLPDDEREKFLNKTSIDMWDDPVHASSWVHTDTRPIKVIKNMGQHMKNDTDKWGRTVLLDREELGWRMNNGTWAPQYGGAVGTQGFGTREVGFDWVAAGQVYTNASYEPDAEWRKEDEAFFEALKAERYPLFGEDWRRWLPEEHEEYLLEQQLVNGDHQYTWDNGLLDAARAGDNIKLREWMARGANVDCVDLRVSKIERHDSEPKWTPLHLAVLYEHNRTVEWLLAYGAFVDPLDKMENTPLHYACCDGGDRMARALLQAGADVMARDACGMTPLHKAVFYNGSFELFQMLLEAGADIDAVDQNYRSPIDLAEIHNRTEMMHILQLFGSKPAHREGCFLGSARDDANTIQEGDWVVLTDDAVRVWDLPLLPDAKKALPLPPMVDRELPFLNYMSCLDVQPRHLQRLRKRFSDCHDGPLVPGMLGRVVKVERYEEKWDGSQWVKPPRYDVNVSWPQGRQVPQWYKDTWGIIDTDAYGNLEWMSGSEDNEEKHYSQGMLPDSWQGVTWAYTPAAVRLATAAEVGPWINSTCWPVFLAGAALERLDMFMEMTGRKAAQRTDAMTDSDPDSGTDNMPFLRDPKRLTACGICGTCDICKAGGLLALGLVAWSQNLDASEMQSINRKLDMCMEVKGKTWEEAAKDFMVGVDDEEGEPGGVMQGDERMEG